MNTVGDILKENGALLNYFKDPAGFNTGVIVILKGFGRHHPKIGWAFFEEVPHFFESHTKMKEIPYYSLYVNKDTVGGTLIPGTSVEQVKLLNEEAKKDLILLAISRANNDSWNYYVSREEDPILSNFKEARRVVEGVATQKNSNLREDKVVLDYASCLNENAYERYNVIVENPCQLSILRKSIRQAEYRAYRYFK